MVACEGSDMMWIVVIAFVAVLLWAGPSILGWLIFSAGPYLLAAAVIVAIGLWVLVPDDGDG